MDKLRNQVFPSHRSLKFFYKNSQEKFKGKQIVLKRIFLSVWTNWKPKDQKKVS